MLSVNKVIVLLIAEIDNGTYDMRDVARLMAKNDYVASFLTARSAGDVEKALQHVDKVFRWRKEQNIWGKNTKHTIHLIFRLFSCHIDVPTYSSKCTARYHHSRSGTHNCMLRFSPMLELHENYMGGGIRELWRYQ